MEKKIIVVSIISIFFLLISTNVSSIGLSKDGYTKVIDGENTIIDIKNSEENPDYIIITTKNFKNYRGPSEDDDFMDLCNYHEEYDNLNSEIVTTDYIRDNYEGNDLQAKIRDYIDIKRPKYILLGGDIEFVPTRYIMSVYDREPMVLKPTPSDFYYSTLDTNWYEGPENFLPNDKDLSKNDEGFKNFILRGEGLFEGSGEELDGFMKWSYKDGSIDQQGICTINFDSPVDLSDINFIYFDIFTNLKEFDIDDMAWEISKLKVIDEGGYEDDSLLFTTDICDTFHNSYEWENKELSFKEHSSNIDYSKISSISFIIRRVIFNDNSEKELNSGDCILINNLHFSDGSDRGFLYKDGGLKPIISIGRTCVDNPADIKNFVRKTLRYLYSDSDDDFVNNVMLVDVLYDTDDGRNLLDNIKNNIFKYCGYNSSKYYYNWNGWADFSEVRNDLLYNDSTNLLLYSGHGKEYGDIDDRSNEVFSNKYIDEFKNYNPFFEYSLGCNVGAFDVDKNSAGECYAEMLTVKTECGAFAGIWYTRPSWTGTMFVIKNFFKAACDWGYSIGKAHKYQIDNVGGSDKFSLTLFGDPTVHLKIPIANSAPSIPDMLSQDMRGKPGKFYSFQVISTEPEGDDIWYGFDWDGDGEVDKSTTQTEIWYGPYNSDEIATIDHKWQGRGIFNIKVKARNNKFFESGWSDSLTITMPKLKLFIISNYKPFFTYFQKYFNLLDLIK